MQETLSVGYVGGAAVAVAGVSAYSLAKALRSPAAHTRVHLFLVLALVLLATVARAGPSPPPPPEATQTGAASAALPAVATRGRTSVDSVPTSIVGKAAVQSQVLSGGRSEAKHEVTHAEAMHEVKHAEAKHEVKHAEAKHELKKGQGGRKNFTHGS